MTPTTESPKAASSSRLKHVRLVEAIKHKIRSGDYGVGDRLPSEAELVQSMKVSRHTVLRGLSMLAAEGWISREQGRGTFVTSRSGDTGVTSKTNAVALICSDHGDALMGRVILGVSRALRARRQELLVLDSDHDAQREAELLRELPWRGIGGALLWPIAPVENRDVVRGLQDQRFPLVLIDRGIDGLDLPVVSVDHERGAYEVTQHLIAQGHRRIAHITARVDEKNPSPAVAAREAGYRRALEEAGIVFEDWMIERVDPALMHMAHEPSLRSVMAYQQAHRLLARKDRPTAIFMLNDVFYPSVLAAARNQGLNVPEDVALAGFNNDPDAWSEVVPLTSYNQPTSEVGFEAADILRQLVEGQVVEPPNRTFAGQLVVRASSDFKRR